MEEARRAFFNPIEANANTASKSHFNKSAPNDGVTTSATITTPSSVASAQPQQQQFASARGRSSGGRGVQSKLKAAGYVPRRSLSTTEPTEVPDYLVKLYEEPRRRLVASRSEDDILNNFRRQYGKEGVLAANANSQDGRKGSVVVGNMAGGMNYAGHKAVSDWMLNQHGNEGGKSGMVSNIGGEPIYSIPDLTTVGKTTSEAAEAKAKKIHYYSQTPDHVDDANDPYKLHRGNRPPPLPTTQPPKKSSTGRKVQPPLETSSTNTSSRTNTTNSRTPTSPATSQLSFTIKMRPTSMFSISNSNSKTDLQSNLTDLARLTKRSRELAHSSENILATTAESITTSSTNSNAQSQNEGDGDTLDMGMFRKTRDFGDFQIYTDSPEKKKQAESNVRPKLGKKVGPPVPPKPKVYKIKSVDV